MTMMMCERCHEREATSTVKAVVDGEPKETQACTECQATWHRLRGALLSTFDDAAVEAVTAHSVRADRLRIQRNWVAVIAAVLLVALIVSVGQHLMDGQTDDEGLIFNMSQTINAPPAAHSPALVGDAIAHSMRRLS